MITLLTTSSLLGWTLYLANRWRVSALRRRLQATSKAYAGSAEANRLLVARLKALTDQVKSLTIADFEEKSAQPEPWLVVPGKPLRTFVPSATQQD